MISCFPKLSATRGVCIRCILRYRRIYSLLTPDCKQRTWIYGRSFAVRKVHSHLCKFRRVRPTVTYVVK